MKVAPIRKRYRIEFEAIGADEVRKNLIGSKWEPEKSLHASQWLDEQQSERDSQLIRDSITITRSAKNAAWIAAIIAIIAAIFAAISIAINLYK